MLKKCSPGYLLGRVTGEIVYFGVVYYVPGAFAVKGALVTGRVENMIAKDYKQTDFSDEVIFSDCMEGSLNAF